jgi:hypothetical protein
LLKPFSIRKKQSLVKSVQAGCGTTLAFIASRRLYREREPFKIASRLEEIILRELRAVSLLHGRV